jgi:hypothetical protein
MLEAGSLREISHTDRVRLVRILPDESKVCLLRVLPLGACSSGS